MTPDNYGEIGNRNLSRNGILNRDTSSWWIPASGISDRCLDMQGEQLG